MDQRELLRGVMEWLGDMRRLREALAALAEAEREERAIVLSPVQPDLLPDSPRRWDVDHEETLISNRSPQITSVNFLAGRSR